MGKVIIKSKEIEELFRKLEKYPDKGNGIFKVCGCTWDLACNDNRRSCWLINQDHNLCSHCFGDLMEIDILSDIKISNKKNNHEKSNIL